MSPILFQQIPTAYNLKRPFNTTAVIQLVTPATSNSIIVQMPNTSGDYFIYDVQITAYDYTGSLVSSAAGRPELLMQYSWSNGSQTYQNQPYDIFAPNTTKQSLQYGGFVIPMQTQFNLSLFLGTNTNPTLHYPYTVYVTWFGYLADNNQ